MRDVINRLNTALEGRYRTERELGAGGMATVYLADDLRHKRKVAVKVLKPELAAALGPTRFLREIETTAGLRHPNVLPLYDSGDADGLLYYVMPFVEGETLRAYLDREEQISIEDALRIAAEVADALSHAHGRGVVHRDIKPENILLENGRAVVADFGIAHAVSESGGENLTQTGSILGTPKYMSPEQIDGAAVDARTDLYSLACMTYEMLAGTPPYVGPSPVVILARHAMEPIPSLRGVRPQVPQGVAEVIERGLAKEPGDRHATIQDWRDDLVSASASGDEAADTDLGIPLPDRPAIAILPFTDLGSDADQGFIADGIRFGIQATLVQLSGLFLVNASTPNLYRGAEMSAESVGRELGVRYILEGAGQQVGQRVRVTVQLTDVEAGRVIWADRYDRQVDDVFELQDEITRRVISALNIELLYHDQVRGWFSAIKSPEACEFFYRGASHLYEGTKEDNAIAREMFTELYRAQPDSVAGPSNLAVTHWFDAHVGWSDDPALSLDQADHWARVAMKYDDNNGIGHAIYGHLRLLEGEYDRALEACGESVELRRSCPLAHSLLGLVLNYLGDPKGAIREVREALRLERVYPPWLLTVLAVAYRDSGEVGSSITAAKQSMRLDPDELDALVVLCSDYQLAGDSARAKAMAAEVQEREPEFRLSTYAQGQPYRDPASLEPVLNALREAGLPD